MSICSPFGVSTTPRPSAIRPSPLLTNARTAGCSVYACGSRAMALSALSSSPVSQIKGDSSSATAARANGHAAGGTVKTLGKGPMTAWGPSFESAPNSTAGKFRS